jgi:hypothetical protein
MARRRGRASRRNRIGKVSCYFRHGSWHVYYREAGKQIRRRAGDTERAAAQLAAQVNAQLSVEAPTLFSFTPLPVAELRKRFLDNHEHVLCSSLPTVRRYSTATRHLENFARTQGANRPAHLLDAEQFVRYLRSLRVSPNGHSHSRRRPLRHKGIRYILETCRSLYGFAARKRYTPPYAENPFAGLGGKRIRIEDAKPVFVFDPATELAFFQAADDWAFPIHFTLAKTGIRPGELSHTTASPARVLSDRGSEPGEGRANCVGPGGANVPPDGLRDLRLPGTGRVPRGKRFRGGGRRRA